MVSDKDVPPKDPDAIGYWVDNPIQVKFLKDQEFRYHLKTYLENLLSTKIAINLQRPPPIKHKWGCTSPPDGFMIELVDTDESETETVRAVADFCQNYLNTIQTKKVEHTEGLWKKKH